MQILALALLLAAQDPADGPRLDDAHLIDRAHTIALNRAIQAKNEAVWRRNAAAQTAYRRERDAYEAALAQNSEDRANAADAARDYREKQAEYQADMARWRAHADAQPPR